MRGLTPAIAAALCLLSLPATAETASEAFRAFGLLGIWSPDCGGPFRTIYAAPSGTAPTVQVTMRGKEIASSEIQETVQVTGREIRWTSIIKSWSLPDQHQESWMPEPGEVWETALEKLADQIRPIRSQRQDGGKISVKDGFIFVGEPAADGRSIIWRNTQKATLPLAKCSAGSPADAERPRGLTG